MSELEGLPEAEVERACVIAAVLAQHRVNFHSRNVGGETADTLRYTSCDGCDWLGGWHDEAGWEGHVAARVAAVLGDIYRFGNDPSPEWVDHCLGTVTR